jgi:hypothetical protein
MCTCNDETCKAARRAQRRSKNKTIGQVLKEAALEILSIDAKAYQAVVSVELARDTRPYIDLAEQTADAPRLEVSRA